MVDSKRSNPEQTKEALPQQRVESRQALTPQNSGSDETGAVDGESATGEIAALAYQYWLERGSPHGSHDEDWYRAEQQLKANQSNSKAASA